MKTIILTIAIFISAYTINSQRIHFISALGCDSTIYSKLTIDSSFDINYVKWIKPLKKESLQEYCDRLIALNSICPEDIVVGTSFGGLVATEISLKVGPARTILISSISLGRERPAKFKFMQLTRCHKMVPKFLMNKPSMIIGRCFGKVNAEEKEYLSELIRRNDVGLVAWSVDQIMKFNNRCEPENLVKINGNRDKTFPVKNVDADIILDGTHMIIYNRAQEISLILNYLFEMEFEINPDNIALRDWEKKLGKSVRDISLKNSSSSGKGELFLY